MRKGNNMTTNEQGEYSSPGGEGKGALEVQRYPNGAARVPSRKERMQDIRSAGIRDQPLPLYTRPGHEGSGLAERCRPT